MGISKSGPIAIIGAGAFGLSTALELSNQGYSNITVFEKDQEIPSRWSAANDLNKIMRVEYEDDFYTNLAIQFKGGELPGWRGYLCRYDGYVHSANALRGIYREAQSKGIRFFLGENVGAIQEIVYDGVGPSRKSVGVRTKAGKFHAASLVIVAVGAAASKIVPEIGSEVSAKSWSVAHIRLTDEETSALRGIPVTYARDFGFLFEPDPKTNLLKLCPMGGGYINKNPLTGVSEAPSGLIRGFVPAEDERKMRELLRQTLPYLADRPLVDKSLCWFADTADSDLIIDYVPQTASSVILLSGDSGQGFKMFPIFGRWVNDLLNETANVQSIARWRWRVPKPKAKGGSDDVSWRIGDVKELREIQESATVPAKL